jgi:predicted transcriptional regulator
MVKTEVYSWRVSSALKGRLEDAARRERRSMAALLEELVELQLTLKERGQGEDDDRQRELHANAAAYAGIMSGGNPQRSKTVRAAVRSRLRNHRDGRR